MKVGIVGFGKMGMLHGALLNSIDNVEIVGVADTSKLVLKAFKSILPNIQYFNSYKQMLDECNLDAVIIATPSFSHVPIAKYAAEKNVHLFIEKPLSSTLEQAIELNNLLKGKDLISMVGFCMRYIPTFIKGKEIINSNKLGKIHSVTSQIYIADVFDEQKGWRYDKKISGGGVLIDFTIHMLDLLFYYFGNIKSVIGKTRSVYSKHVEDEVEAQIFFENGISAKLDSSWSKPEYRKTYAKIEVHADKGTLVVTDQNVKIDMLDSNSSEAYNYPDLYEGYYIDIGGPLYSIQMKTFVDLINKNQKSEIGVENGLYIQRIIDLIYTSAELNKQLDLNGVDNNE